MNIATKVRRAIWRTTGIAFVIAGMLAGFSGSVGSQSAARLEIKTLSSRADLVSGGDALVEVNAPAGAKVTLTLNGKDVSSQLKPEGSNLRGLVSGFNVGENMLLAKAGKAQATLKVTNYPITGPILSGAHLTPYECRTVESGLRQPLDANCSAKQKIEFFYRAKDNIFKPLTDPVARPADLATTTTYDGKTVPYIVRVDSGTINRSIYRIAILDDPNPETNGGRWMPGAGWNRKLAVSFGGGAGTQYN
ncbi:MAG: DUF6351 family protein, partial [Blastocatellia bacterium]